MRWSWLLLAGCGRLGFADQPDAQGVPGDAAADVAADAAPICASPCTVADSMADYSGATQGANGWSYGYWWIDQDTDGIYDGAVDFIPMTAPNGIWNPPDYNADPMSAQFTWCYLAAWGGHPGWSPQRKYPVRRWTSTVAGAARLAPYIGKSDTAGGNGTRAHLIVDGSEVWTQDVAFDDMVGVTGDVPAVLHVGSLIDYMLDPIGDDAVDTTNMTLTVNGP